MIFKNKKNQRGDSLIAIAVSIVALGVTMTIAYVLLRSSFNQGQEAKERAQVRKLVNSQVEILKTYMLHPRASGDPDLIDVVCSASELSACLDGAGGFDNQAAKKLEIFCFNEYDYLIHPRIGTDYLDFFKEPPQNAIRYSASNENFTPESEHTDVDNPTHIDLNDNSHAKNPIDDGDTRITTVDDIRRYYECAGTTGDIANANVVVGIVYYNDPDGSNTLNVGPPPLRKNGDEYLFNVRAYWTARGGQIDSLEASIRLDPILADPIQSQFN